MADMKKVYDYLIIINLDHTGTEGPLLTLFFETLEKQPYKQKTV